VSLRHRFDRDLHPLGDDPSLGVTAVTRSPRAGAERGGKVEGYELHSLVEHHPGGQRTVQTPGQKHHRSLPVAFFCLSHITQLRSCS
jgi:hypothetical protein